MVIKTSLHDERKVHWWSLSFSRAQNRSGFYAPVYNPLKLSQLQNPDCSIAASETQSYRELGAASSLARLLPPLQLLRFRQTQPSAIAYAHIAVPGDYRFTFTGSLYNSGDLTGTVCPSKAHR